MCDDLDRFALLACQDYNLGNGGDWFWCFRAGLQGFYGRTYGVRCHYEAVHAWRASVRGPLETEYHVSSTLFNMDSSIECLAFAFNALGWAASPAEFRDVTSERELRRIRPENVLGEVPGYARLFPSLQAHWQANEGLLRAVMEHHDASKHREMLVLSSQARDDPPAGFFESLGLDGDSPMRYLCSPMAEILLGPEPKTPAVVRLANPWARDECLSFEGLGADFCEFVNTSCLHGYQDAKAHIALPHADPLQG